MYIPTKSAIAIHKKLLVLYVH